ncbi:hypothetical protein JRO89_XS01G0059800 [Xanthoceras sorbifolium]|uniref:Uncharacterized protein n=1 Tax=Xanthoceras sorbifolium TaxID=99658 RepID=A0ABQ8IIE5_9ROSI|nr:hypothetical protein JRO89_XS01G0059800 [Xanthoceras sorbifolium]
MGGDEQRSRGGDGDKRCEPREFVRKRERLKGNNTFHYGPLEELAGIFNKLSQLNLVLVQDWKLWMDLQMNINRVEDEYEDWKGRKADSKKYGGIRAASFACVVEVLENTVFLCNASNFVAYFLKSMHYSAAESANTRLVLLTIQASFTQLQPAIGRRPSQSQAAILYAGLYSMATGVGGVKASLPAHGGDQLDHSNHRLISAFFNWFFFSLCTGGLISATVMVWIQENKGWTWSFKISVIALTLALCIFITGFPFYRYKRLGGSSITRIFKVLASVVRNRKASLENAISESNTSRSNKFRFLDKALCDDKISATGVDETRTFLGLLPLFASTIMMNCCLAQLQTFSVQQGNIMNRSLHHFQIPTQSLSVFPLTIMLVSLPLYERFAHIFGNRISSKHNIFKPLKRIGLGLALASGSMAVAALVEYKRRSAAVESYVTLSVFWLVWQYLLLGVSDMLTLGGMLEFFYSEAPHSMRSICTSLSWCSTSMGYFLSSVLVSLTNLVSRKFGREWLGGNDLNHTRLDLFYTLLCILNLTFSTTFTGLRAKEMIGRLEKIVGEPLSRDVPKLSIMNVEHGEKILYLQQAVVDILKDVEVLFNNVKLE